MFSQKLFDEISNKISETIAASPAKDLEKNIKAMMAATFSRMDLVTREEFDIQQEVLAQTRAQLTAMESRLAQLEVQLNPPVAEQASEAADSEQQG